MGISGGHGPGGSRWTRLTLSLSSRRHLRRPDTPGVARAEPEHRRPEAGRRRGEEAPPQAGRRRGRPGLRPQRARGRLSRAPTGRPVGRPGRIEWADFATGARCRGGQAVGPLTRSWRARRLSRPPLRWPQRTSLASPDARSALREAWRVTLSSPGGAGPCCRAARGRCSTIARSRSSAGLGERRPDARGPAIASIFTNRIMQISRTKLVVSAFGDHLEIVAPRPGGCRTSGFS